MKLFSIVTFSTTMSTASNVAKRSYTSNTLATDVSEVSTNIFFFLKIVIWRGKIKKKGEISFIHIIILKQGIVLRDPLINLA